MVIQIAVVIGPLNGNGFFDGLQGLIGVSRDQIKEHIGSFGEQLAAGLQCNQRIVKAWWGRVIGDGLNFGPMLAEPPLEGRFKMMVLNCFKRGHVEGRLPGLKEWVAHVGSTLMESKRV